MLFTAWNSNEPAFYEPSIHSIICCQLILFPKGGFKSEETGGFLPLQNKYSKSLSWAEYLDFPPKTVNNLFNFSAQDSD